jgi:hypothetical protein
MNSLVVERVQPYAPDAESASVTLRSDRGTLEVFCYSCALKEGERVPNLLVALDAQVRTAYLSDWPEYQKAAQSVERLEKTGPYSYRGRGRVVDQPQGVVEVLGFRLDVGRVPCDGYVEFECLRIDVEG